MTLFKSSLNVLNIDGLVRESYVPFKEAASLLHLKTLQLFQLEIDLWALGYKIA